MWYALTTFLFLSYFSGLFAQKTSNIVKANLGEDISAPGLTTIVLDASSSTPQNGSLTYEWSFPPDMIFLDEYEFQNSDTPISYENSTSDRISLKALTTRNKFIEIDLPNLPGQAYEVSLRVQNHVGMEDWDEIVITVEEPINLNSVNTFSDSSLHSMGDKNFIIVDGSNEKREPLTETVIYDDLLTIQALNKSKLSPMSVDIINGYIYSLLKKRGYNNVLDPRRYIPEEIAVNKLFNRVRYEQDSIQVTTLDTISVSEDLSSYLIAPLDTLVNNLFVDDSTFKSDTFYIYRSFSYQASIDTLSYTEVVDTVFQYNFNCSDYDCVAENAYLEQAGSILSWGLNDYDELEFHYFKLNGIYSSDAMGEWISEPIVLNSLADSLMKYPQSVSFDSTGSPVVVVGNNQDILFLNKNSYPISLLKNYSERYDIRYPSGICVGGLGELYITDKGSNAVFWLYEGVISTIYSTPKYENGFNIPGEPTLPSAIRLNTEEDIFVLFEGDGSVRKFDRKGSQTVVLQPGVIQHPTDIAINNDDTLFVASKIDGLVYKVKNGSEVVVVAGNMEGITTAMDGVPATESYLGEPVSIDFDISNRLYIADNSFGSIRVVTPDGIINSLTNDDNKVFNISSMRINNDRQTTLYTSHTFEHDLTRIRYQIFSPNSRFSYIFFPNFIIKKEGVYGLEAPIENALESVLVDVLPKKKKPLFSQISESRKKVSSYFKSHPFIFAILFIALNQGISIAVDDGGPVEFPPDFPPN